MSTAVLPPDAKHRLLEAAEEVFADKGFKATTIREIAEKARANIAAVNYHFGDKERLYIETVKRAHACASMHVEPPQWPVGLPPAEKLRDFIAVMAGSMTTPANPNAVKLLMRELTHPSLATRTIVEDYIRPNAFLLRDILREMLPGADERRLLMVGFSIMGQCLYYRQNRLVSEMLFGEEHMNALAPADIIGHITRFTLAALGREPPITAADLVPPLGGAA